MLRIATAFSLWYGLSFSWLAAHLDADFFEVVGADLNRYMRGGLDDMREEAEAHGEFAILRSWIEYLIACRPVDLAALNIPWLRSRTDMVLPIPGLGGLTEDAWQYLLQYVRSQLFGTNEPMTDEEKAEVLRTVTIVEEDLGDFRKRMLAEGRLEPAQGEES